MLLVQSIQKGEARTLGNLAKVIAESVTRFGNQIVLCPDRYDAEYSIKSFDREKRATASSREHVIHNERTQLSSNSKEVLMNAKNKSFVHFFRAKLFSGIFAFCLTKSSRGECGSCGWFILENKLTRQRPIV